MSKGKAVALSLTIVAVIVAWFVYDYLTWDYSGWTTAKEAFSVAAPYALAGEPDAQLEEMRLSGSWSSKEEDLGKSDAWELTFCAPDGAYIKLEVEKETLFVRYPWDGPASEKESSDLWDEARTGDYTRVSEYIHPIEN